jgi:BNR repeat protein
MSRRVLMRLAVSLTAIAGLSLCVLAIAPRLATASAPRKAPTAPPQFTTQTRMGFAAGDDWEPAVAADRYGHVYLLYKHYDVTGQTTCASCDQHLLLQVSGDNGQTWSVPTPIDPEATKGGQFDSQIAVDPVDGRTVWASFLQNSKSSIAVMKSTDFGQTWSGPTIVENLQRSTDKDELAVRGQTIAVAYNAVQKIYAAISHDGGATWTTSLISDGSNQLGWSLGGGAGIDSHGNIFFGFAGYTQNGGAKGPVNLFVAASYDGGASWSLTTTAVSGAPYPCANCGFAFLGAQLTLAIGGDDSVNLLWNSTVDQTNYAPERIFFARSTDGGHTYSARQDVSRAASGVEHSFPAIIAGGAGDMRIGWMDTRTGAWNLFYCNSTNGGATWSAETRVSGYVPGFSYLTSAGFGLPYGDYFQMAIDSAGATQIGWGESGSYAGPGNIWVSHN